MVESESSYRTESAQRGARRVPLFPIFEKSCLALEFRPILLPSEHPQTLIWDNPADGEMNSVQTLKLGSTAAGIIPYERTVAAQIVTSRGRGAFRSRRPRGSQVL